MYTTACLCSPNTTNAALNRLQHFHTASPSLFPPVVPLVYMMVHRSSGLGGTGSTGLAAPSFFSSSNENKL